MKPLMPPPMKCPKCEELIPFTWMVPHLERHEHRETLRRLHDLIRGHQ